MLNGIYEDCCDFYIKMKNKAIKLRTGGWDSLRNCTCTYNIFNNVKISYKIIRQSLLIFEGLYYLNEDLKPSGYLAYVVQGIRINIKWYYWYVLWDMVHKILMVGLLAKKEDSKTIKIFLKNSIRPKESIAILTDLKPSYDKIMKELGFIHQHYIFHVLQNIYDAFGPELTK